MEIKDNKISTKLGSENSVSKTVENAQKTVQNELLSKTNSHKNINLTDILKKPFY
jgi:hypothetical protein